MKTLTTYEKQIGDYTYSVFCEKQDKNGLYVFTVKKVAYFEWSNQPIIFDTAEDISALTHEDALNYYLQNHGE